MKTLFASPSWLEKQQQNKTKKKKNLWRNWSRVYRSDIRLPSLLLYKKPLYKLSSQQISQQTSGTAYIYTQVVHSNPRQPTAALIQIIMKQRMTFFFSFFPFFCCFFFADAKAVQETTKTLFSPLVFRLTCWQSTWIQCNIFEYWIHECMYIIQCQTANVLRRSMTGVHAKMWKHFAVGQINFFLLCFLFPFLKGV